MPPRNVNINKKVARRPGMLRRRIATVLANILLMMVVVLLCAGAVWGAHYFLQRALQHPRFVIRRIYIPHTGVRTITDEEIKVLAGIRPNMNIYATSLDPIERRILRHPDVASVRIVKRHPDTLEISLTEREPVAVILTPGRAPDIPIDREGRMLSERKMEHALHLPKLTGLGPVRYEPGAVVNDPRVPVAMRFVDAIQRVQQHVFLDIKRVRFDRPGMIIIQTATIDEIRLGDTYSLDLVLRLVATVERLRAQRLNAKSIDLRFKDVVVTPMAL
ncbi:MAG: FtsQ-type POTRA domain-containing protein [bacterium]|nr:FtsQ-type POTRA domain-containing protein [bacterium]